jgi:hypothetical protein
MSGSIVRRWIGGVLLAAGLAGCASGPKPPLMSPIAATRSYGYSEVQAGENTYEVTYTMPLRRSLVSAARREADIAASRTEAYDLALWRAAQLALEHGFPGFRVINSHANVDTTIEDQYDDPFWGDPFFGPPLWHRHFRPYPFGYPYGAYSPQAYLRAQVTLNVLLLQSPAPGDYDAQDVIRQLQKTYPNAERETAALDDSRFRRGSGRASASS